MQRMRTTIQTQSILSNAQGVAKLGPRPGRVCVLIGETGGGAFDLQIGTSPNATDGVRVSANVTSVMFNYRDWGDGLDGEWTMIHQAVAQVTFVVIEAVLAP